MSFDWSIGPQIQDIKSLHIKEPNSYTLDNGIKVIEVIGSGQPVIKVDIVFKGGRLLEEKELTARFTSALMRESTNHHTSEYIAEFLDFSGTNIRAASNMDYNYLSFSCLNKHLNQVMPIISEMILEPKFDETELSKYKRKSIENLKLDLSKSELICYREFTSLIYGDLHPYGYNTTEDSLNSIDRNDVLSQYKRSITTNNCFIVVSGNPNKQFRPLLNKYLGNFQRDYTSVNWQEPVMATNNITASFSSKNELQTAIKVGKRLFNRNHPDYPGMFILNTILGGYFGSRLMTSIREQKGYTYNVYSTVDHLTYDGYFYVATEVDNSYVDDTLKTIFQEFDILQNDIIPEIELNMVKNYLAGNFLTLIDGPFLMGSLLRSLHAEGRQLSDFKNFYQKIQDITPQEVQDLAIKHLRASDMTVVKVGI